MNVASKLNPGSAIEELRQRRNTELTTDFNQKINEIDTQASDQETLFSTIEKGTGVVVGTGALLKGAYQKLSQLKTKLKGLRGKGEDESTNGTDDIQYNETELQPTEVEIPNTEMGGGTQVTSEPSGTGVGDVELSESVASAENQPSTEGADPDFTGEGEDVAEDVGEDVGESVAEGGAEAGVEAGAEAGLGATLEAFGTAADATGFGAVAGVILNIVGAAVLAGGIGVGIAGDISTANQEKEDTQNAQQQYNQQLQGAIPGVAGRFAT